MEPVGLVFTMEVVSVWDIVYAGQVIVADGTDEAARRIERTLTSDPEWVLLDTLMPDMRRQ